jgi:succinylglutamate desuccinylase
MNIIKSIVWLQPGPRTCIMAWVHGNEIGAQQLLYYLSEHITVECGEVIFVIASPQSIELNVRYIDHNLNRLTLVTISLIFIIRLGLRHNRS